jgi:RimJ/RimL family protein N-acetyltransferase
MIVTARLLLREVEAGDWQAIYQWCSDPEVVRFNLSGGPSTEERSRAYVQQAIAWAKEQPRRDCAFAIILRADGQLIGGCRLRVIDPDSRVADIGFGLYRQFWGQGFATEAVRALLSFGFEEPGMHHLSGEPIAANTASIRVMEKVGMRREGHFRERYWFEDRWWDSFHYAILDHEWQDQKSRPGTIRLACTG